MSGVEVAGLILAVLPLFISAAEHYKDGIGFVKRAIKKEQFALRYKEELTEQKALLALYIKGVVGRTELSAQTQLALVNDPTGDAWRRPDVIKQVSDELAEAYQPFLDAISRICKALSKQIKEEDGAGSNDGDVVQQLQELCLDSKKASSSEAKKAKIFERIKFSWKSSQRAEILTELQGCNKMLEKLSVAADRAKPYIRKQQSRRVHTAYENREVMQRLFEILRNACNCTPAETRQVGLRLQVHASDDEDLESTFQLILFLSQGVICELSAKIARAATEPPVKKKVRLDAPSGSSNALTNASNPSMKILTDICQEMSQAHACKSCLHLVVDKHEKVYCSALQRTPQTSTQPTSQHLLSLADIMSKLKIYNHKRWLHKEKSILAIILAYSLLQLHDSPWSQSHWSSNNLTFLDTGLSIQPQPNAGVHLQLRRPYTRSQVAAASSAANITSPTTTRRNAHLHALGIVLLELYLNRSIQPSHSTSTTQTPNYRSIAQDLLEDHADDMSMTPEYLQAVRFCLAPRPNPYSGSFSFEDKGFREIYYEEVIAMLEQNLSSRFEVNESIWLGQGAG